MKAARRHREQVWQGTAVYYASFFNLEAARHLMRRYTAEYGLKPLLTGIPRDIEVTRRTKGKASTTSC